MKRSKGRSRMVPGGERIFQRIYTRIGCEGRPPHFVVEYHPYADLTHTIRLREDTAYVRISDLLRDAPRHVFESAAGILLGRLYRRQPPGEFSQRIASTLTHTPRGADCWWFASDARDA